MQSAIVKARYGRILLEENSLLVATLAMRFLT